MTRPTLFGRYQVPETPSSLRSLHFHDPAVTLKEVDHEPKVAVLDQEDLFAQGIHVSTFIPGATDVDALGSCTAQATTAALSNLLAAADFLALVDAHGFDDTKAAESWAISFYHRCTDQTGDPAQEWPPTDCGSSGPYVVSELEALKLASGAQVASGATGIVSLVQAGGAIVGQPFFNAWMEPDGQGFIDGDGSPDSLQAAIASGVAGGHETYLSAVEKLVLDHAGRVDPFGTVLRFRNSWSPSWGDSGSYRAHLSTYTALAQYVDVRRLLAA